MLAADWKRYIGNLTPVDQLVRVGRLKICALWVRIPPGVFKKMAETRRMKYYSLQRGDYIQSGDEFLSKDDESWLLISDSYFGLKYGYDTDNLGKATEWRACRRLVPDGFKRTTEIVVGMQEQYGLEFEF